MKNLLPLLLVTLFIQGCDQKSTNGRFQIIAVTQDVVATSAIDNSGETTQSHRVFKLDTVTGETWFYSDYSIAVTNGLIHLVGWKETGSLTNWLQKYH
ncbi:MAG: hypothetical protein WDN00_05605 [Limisphaerales bacterium]